MNLVRLVQGGTDLAAEIAAEQGARTDGDKTTRAAADRRAKKTAAGRADNGADRLLGSANRPAAGRQRHYSRNCQRSRSTQNGESHIPTRQFENRFKGRLCVNRKSGGAGKGGARS